MSHPWCWYSYGSMVLCHDLSYLSSQPLKATIHQPMFLDLALTNSAKGSVQDIKDNNFVGQNGNHKGKPVMDRWPRNSYQGSKGTRGMLGKARLVSRRGLIGVSPEKRAKQ